MHISLVSMEGPRINRQFRWPVRVYYEDTDSGGVVYYANYLKYMERARTEYLRALGFEQDVLNEQQQILFAVRGVEIEYLRPARFNAALEVTAAIEEKRRASILFDQQVLDPHTDDRPYCRARIRIACLHSRTMKPCAIPPEILKEI